MAKQYTELKGRIGKAGASADAKPHRLRWVIETFGERFRLKLNDGQHETSMLLTPADLRAIRDRATVALGEGRDARKRLRAHRNETP